MNAIVVARHGGPEVLELAAVAEPRPGPGQLQVRVHFAGVNYIDTYQRKGLYPRELPFVPGLEGAGVVEEVGAGAGIAGTGTGTGTGVEWRVGDRVAWAMTPGSYAEQVCVEAWKLARVPDGVGLDAAAALMLQGMTAHYLVTDSFRVDAGSWVLVHAAAGGVGLLLCQLAAAAGAQVIGTVSTGEKAALAHAAGAEHTIRYTAEDFVGRVAELTAGRGVDVVYDSVGRDTFEGSLKCLRPRGYLVLFGQSSGPVGRFDPQLLNQHGSLFLTRPSLAHYTADAAEVGRRAGALFRALADGGLALRIDRVLPLAAAAEAHDALEGRETAGKVLLAV
jgi:NADPH:quinone reductase